MIKKAIVGIVLACAACCTVPLLIPALAGASVFGLSVFQGRASLDSIICGLGFAFLAFALVYFGVRVIVKGKAKAECGKVTCSAQGTCGCKKN